MKRHPVTLLRYRIVCKKNGHEVLTYGFGDFAEYGIKPAWTPIPDDFSYIDCLQDAVCEEVGAIVDDLLSSSSKKEWGQADCFENVLGVACDPAPSGQQYSFAGPGSCPVCGSTNITYGPVIPYVSETVDVPVISHDHWTRLMPEAKRDTIQQALKNIGCLG